MTEKVARILFDAMNSRDLTNLEKSMLETARFDFPGAGCIEGRRKILTFLKVLFRKYTRLEFTVQETVIDGDKVCVLWTNSGEHSGGELYSNTGITYIEIEDGKIAFISDYFKDTSFVRK